MMRDVGECDYALLYMFIQKPPGSKPIKRIFGVIIVTIITMQIVAADLHTQMCVQIVMTPGDVCANRHDTRRCVCSAWAIWVCKSEAGLTLCN